MKHIKINKDGVRNLINGLAKFKKQVTDSCSEVNGCNLVNSSFAGEKPVDLSNFITELYNKCGDIQKQIDLLQSRLDTAIAANEGGGDDHQP